MVAGQIKKDGPGVFRFVYNVMDLNIELVVIQDHVGTAGRFEDFKGYPVGVNGKGGEKKGRQNNQPGYYAEQRNEP